MKVSSWIRRKLARAPKNETLPLGELEFVLVDVDLTGTDTSKDSVIGLAALPLSNGCFRLDDLRYCRLPSPSNHRQVCAPDCAAAYAAILDLLVKRTVFTINPRFVRHILGRTAALFQLPPPGGDWLDLPAAAGVVACHGSVLTSMAYWQEKMRTGGRQEHDAVYDVFAMAQQLQAVLAYAEEMGIETMADLQRNQRAETWLRPY